MLRRSSIAVANRTYERAQDLAIESGVRAVRWDDVDAELAAADVLISCTGANGVVFDRRASRHPVDA